MPTSEAISRARAISRSRVTLECASIAGPEAASSSSTPRATSVFLRMVAAM